MTIPGSTGGRARALLYTGFDHFESRTAMPLDLSRRITHRNILTVLAGGFGLVTILLLAAAAIAVQNSRAIQTDAAAILREQSLTARLMNQMRVEQATLNAVFYQLTRDPESVDRAELLRQLDATGDTLGQLARNAERTPEADLWRRLDRSADAFAAEARRVIAVANLSDSSLRALFKLHDQVIRVIRELGDASSTRARTAELKIAADARDHLNRSVLLLGGSFVLALVCALLTVRFTATLFRRMERQATELSRVSWHMLRGQEEAARRFSHELHDELGQSLTALKTNLAALTPANLVERRNDCLQLVDDAIANIRELSQLLRPVILDDFGLDAGLRWQLEKFGMRTGIEARFDGDVHDRLPDETETHLFRIAQEALTNVARHSGATRVAITLRQKPDRVVLTITDNGRGLRSNRSAVAPGIGMIGMRARAREAGGDFAVREAAGGGVEVEVWVPAARMGSHAVEEDTHPVSR